MTKEQRKARDADFRNRMKPRLLWDSDRLGTYRRKDHGPLR